MNPVPYLQARDLPPPAAGLAERRRVSALQGRDRVTAWSGATRLLWHGVREVARRKPTRPIRVLDVATGAGGVPIRLWRAASRSGLKIAVDGCDMNPTSLELARRRARESGVPVRFFRASPLRGNLPEDYDVITCSLTLHRLSDHRAARLLRALDGAALQRVLIQDHLRTARGVTLARLTSSLVHGAATPDEAECAIRSAFTVEELRELTAEAGIAEADVEAHWPSCLLLSWEAGQIPRSRAYSSPA